MGWFAPLIGMAAGMMGAKGQRDQQKQQQWYMRPEQIQARMYQMNPWMQAADNWSGPSQFGNLFGGGMDRPQGLSDAQYEWFKMATNPGYIDPAVMNQYHTNVERTGDMNQQRARSVMGRTGMQGGMARAYELGNYGQRTLAHAQGNAQFAQMREMQKRQDMSMVQGARQNAEQMATGGQANMAQTEPNNWWQYGSNALMSGLDTGMFDPQTWKGGAFGNKGNVWGQAQPQQGGQSQSQIQTGNAFNNFWGNKLGYKT